MGAIRTHCLDASALVKLYVNEPGSAEIRSYKNEHSTFSTTSLCFVETLGVLKGKLRRGDITRDEYFNACNDFLAEITYESIKVDELEIANRENYSEVERVAKKYSLDISDAFQIVTLKIGFFSQMIGDSQCILITADEDLANAARGEGLRVWDCLKEPAP